MKKKSLPAESGVHNDQPIKAIHSFDSIYKQYVKKVYHQCLSMAKDSEMAQDYTQDIFIKAFTKLDSFQNQSAFSTWLFSIAHNYCIDQLKRSKRHFTVGLSDRLIQNLREPEKQVSVDYQLQQLDRILDQLPADEVAMLRLKYEQNQSIKQLSQHFQLSESAVKMRLSRSREKVQRLYTQQFLG